MLYRRKETNYGAQYDLYEIEYVKRLESLAIAKQGRTRGSHQPNEPNPGFRLGWVVVGVVAIHLPIVVWLYATTN